MGETVKATTMQIAFELNVTGMIRYDAETKCFVTYCPELDLHSAGRTEPDAKRALESALRLWVTTCFELGILERELKERGFKNVAAGPVAEPTGDAFRVIVSAPLQLLRQRPQAEAA